MAPSRTPESLWTEAFGNEKCPTLYSSSKPQQNRFSVLTSPERFLKDLGPLSHTQLYALAENCQLALKTAQDEYLNIERWVRLLEQKEPPTNPQTLLDPDRFEEEKEAALYGYKRIPRGIPYTRTRDGTDFHGFQEPFSQGGFVPTDAQYKRIRANAKKSNNVDEWTPIEKDGKKLVPRLPRSPPLRQQGFTGALSRPSRKRRLVEQGLSDTDATTRFSDSDVGYTPSKRATRFLGRKIPPTRDSSEAPITSRRSPISNRQHKFMSNLTQSLMSIPASTHSSTQPALAPCETSSSPSATKKRRRIDNNDHQPPKSGPAMATNPHSSPSYYDSEEKKWTDLSLIAAINADHSFLHPDPAVALTWKNAILNASNPVRSYAMKRKWAWWKEGGMDKRPRRAWREGTGEGDDESHENEVRDESRMKLEHANESHENEIRDEPQTKLEGANESNSARQDEDENGELGPGNQSHPATCLERSSPARKYTTSANEAGGDSISTSTKESPAQKQQQQKHRQFTFKFDQPPAPQLSSPLPSERSPSSWLAKE